jgi:hypothetical protein
MSGPHRLPSARHFRQSREWRVMIVESLAPAEPAGKIYRLSSFSRAVNLAGDMSRDRRLGLQINASPF